MVKYFGDKYFSEKWFICEVRSKEIYINNTNCLFIKDTSFDTFYLIREIIKEGFTDDIWETFRGMFEERLINDEGILESEQA